MLVHTKLFQPSLKTLQLSTNIRKLQAKKFYNIGPGVSTKYFSYLWDYWLSRDKSSSTSILRNFVTYDRKTSITLASDCKIIFLTFSWMGGQSLYMKFSPSLYSHHWLDSNPSPRNDEVRILPLSYIGPRGQCYKTDTAVINCHFRLNYCSNFSNIEFTLEWQ